MYRIRESYILCMVQRGLRSDPSKAIDKMPCRRRSAKPGCKMSLTYASLAELSMQLFERSLPEFRSLNASSTFEKVGPVSAEKSARSGDCEPTAAAGSLACCDATVG